tara:strand:- start:19127 stop:20137 length:1011 start_codon:yes stop_codon:yes gene_type:complete
MQILALTDSLAPWHSFRIRFGQYIDSLPWPVKISESRSDLKHLQRGDVLFFYRYLPSWGCINDELFILKKRGVSIITDLDDCVWQAPLGWDRERQKLYTRALDMADLITCSTVDLQCLVQQMFPRQKTEIVRNSAPYKAFTKPEASNRSSTLRVCWTGCPWTRPEDLALLKPLVNWIKSQQISVIWRHIGHAEGRLSFAEAVGLDARSVEAISIGSHEHFLNALKGDIGLAPVTAKCFNTYKSEIKLLEFGSRGMAWIASDTPAYRDLCERWGAAGRLCQTGDDWIRHFQQLLDPSIRIREQRAWREMTTLHQSHQHTAKQWISVLERVQMSVSRR